MFYCNVPILGTYVHVLYKSSTLTIAVIMLLFSAEALSEKKNRGRMKKAPFTKAMIGAPTDFHHLSHAGFDQSATNQMVPKSAIRTKLFR